MPSVRQLRKGHSEGLLACASQYIKELLTHAPVCEIARDHFMEALNRICERGPDFPVHDEIDDMLRVIGSCYVLLDICAHGSPEEVEVMNDALRFAALDTKTCQNMLDDEVA